MTRPTSPARTDAAAGTCFRSVPQSGWPGSSVYELLVPTYSAPPRNPVISGTKSGRVGAMYRFESALRRDVQIVIL
jgi:hypothetical protein